MILNFAANQVDKQRHEDHIPNQQKTSSNELSELEPKKKKHINGFAITFISLTPASCREREGEGVDITGKGMRDGFPNDGKQDCDDGYEKDSI